MERALIVEYRACIEELLGPDARAAGAGGRSRASPRTSGATAM
jgi:hypothetical protein